jgi:hypothetical protein
MATTTILVDTALRTPGSATLAELVDTHHTVLIVTPDEALAKHFGCPHHANQVIGSLYRTTSGWHVTAFTDRDHLLNNTGPAYFLPNAQSRASAVRALLRWWWMVARADRDAAATLDPFALSPKELRALMR